MHVSFTSVVYAISKNIPYSAQFFHIDAMSTPCLQLCPVGRTPLSFSPPTTLTLYLNFSHPSQLFDPLSYLAVSSHTLSGLHERKTHSHDVLTLATLLQKAVAGG